MGKRIDKAILSVADKTGIVEFAKGLCEFGIGLISTGRTARELTAANIPVTDIADYTGFPGFGDLVKTLHPRVHGGILGDRCHDAMEMQRLGIHPIGLVVANFYPFESIAADPHYDCVDEVLRAGMDIGGPAMVRGAVKNHRHVGVVVEPRDYGAVLRDLEETDGRMSQRLRRSLAVKALWAIAQYDTAIAQWLSAQPHES